MNDQRFQALLADDRWLARLPTAVRAFVEAHVRLRDYADRATLYSTGDDGDGLYRVAAGEVRLVGYPVVGRQVVTLIARAGHWFGELSVIDGGPRPHDAVCHGPTTILHLPMRDIETLARAEPAIFGQIALIACAHSRDALTFIETILTKPSRARLADMILRTISTRTAEAGGEIALHVSQEDLAGRIGVSRQHLNAMLADLRRRNILCPSYGCIRIIDVPALAALADDGQQ